AAVGAKAYGGMPANMAESLEFTIPQNPTLNDLRKIRTQVAKVADSPSATNALKEAAGHINAQIGTTIDDTLSGLGETPEQAGARHALDQEWGRFQRTMNTLDPR